MVNHMGIGGVEKTLLSLLSTIDYKKYSVDLLLINKSGQLIPYIPKNVNVISLDIPTHLYEKLFYGRVCLLKSYLRDMKFKKTINIFCEIILNLCKNQNQKRISLYEEAERILPDFLQEYDIALDFMGYASFSTFYIAKKVSAEVKATWLHSELSKSNTTLQEYYKIYQCYDKFFGVSQTCVEEFKKEFPIFESKTEVFYNLISSNLIINMAKEGKKFNDNFNGLRILTVGRLAPEKGYDIAVKVLKELISEGYNVKWYVLGEGPEYNNILNLVKDNNLEKKFILLGADPNPYGYMNNCDIYVQPSRYEGYSTTTNEARILCKPVITTDVSGAREQFIHDVTGLIVKCEISSIKKSIIELIKNEEKRYYLSKNLSKLKIDNEDEVKKLYRLSK